MSQREKLLAAAVIALVAILAGKHYYGRYTDLLRARKADAETAHTKYLEAKKKLDAGHLAVKQVEAAEKRSLPANYEKALSLYKAWLLVKAKDAGLAVSDIKSTSVNRSSTAFKAVSYQIVATGSLSNVVAMMYEFYRSPQLHQITRLQLIRQPGSSQLQVTMDVEGLSLKGASETDKLPEGDSKRLKLASADAYKKSFAELAFFSGAVSNGSGWQAWINVRSTGETLHLAAGESLKVGALEGKIVSVEPHSLVFKTGDKQFRVALGQSLRKGTEIGAPGDVKNKRAEAPPKS